MSRGTRKYAYTVGPRISTLEMDSDALFGYEVNSRESTPNMDTALLAARKKVKTLTPMYVLGHNCDDLCAGDKNGLIYVAAYDKHLITVIAKNGLRGSRDFCTHYADFEQSVVDQIRKVFCKDPNVEGVRIFCPVLFKSWTIIEHLIIFDETVKSNIYIRDPSDQLSNKEIQMITKDIYKHIGKKDIVTTLRDICNKQQLKVSLYTYNKNAFNCESVPTQNDNNFQLVIDQIIGLARPKLPQFDFAD